MLSKRSLPLICAAVLAVLISGPAARAEIATFPQPGTFTLDNGLQVVVIEDHRAPVVTHMVWYKVGAADDPPGKSGIAHFLEHLMFKGTDKIADSEFSKIIARNGGQDNAFTSYDYTAYYQRVAKDRLALVMGMEADRMANLRLTDEQVVPERDVVREERRSRTDNNPGSLLSEQVRASLFRNHPYGIPVIGWMQEVATLNRDDALNFYRRYYTPNNAILIVAGDVTPDAVRVLAEKYYGGIPRGPDMVRARPQEPPQIAPRRVEFKDQKVRTPSFSRMYFSPSFASSGETLKAHALEVLSEILGGATGRLHRSIVIDQAIATGSGAWYSGAGLDSGLFGFYVAPRPDTTLAEAEAAIDREIDLLLKDGITDEELNRAKRSLISAAIFAQDSQVSMARIYGASLTTGESVADVVNWPLEIDKVTADDVMDVAREVLKIEASVTGYLRPKTEEEG